MTRKRLCPFYLRYRDRKNGILLEQAAKKGLSRDDPVSGLTTIKAWRIGPLCYLPPGSHLILRNSCYVILSHLMK